MPKRTLTTSTLWPLVAQSLLLLAAFAVRIALYDTHGLDGDDGFTLLLLQNDVAALFGGLLSMELDVHPPLYFVALKLWTSLAGESLLALRLFNLLPDMLVGALLLRSSNLLGQRVWWFAGLMWLFAPLLIYSDQLLRMYTLMAFWSALGTLSLLEMARGRRIWVPGLLMATAGALYTHLFGLLLLASGCFALCALWLLQAMSWKTVLATLSATALLFMSYLPLLANRFATSEVGGTAGQFPGLVAPPLQIPGQILSVALFNQRMPNVGISTLLVLCVLMLAVGLWRNRTALRWGLLALVGGLYVSLIAAALAGFFRPRYISLLVPPLILFAAVALQVWLDAIGPKWIRRLTVTGISAGLVASNIAALHAYSQPSRSDDFRAAAHFLTGRANADDLILVVPDWGHHALAYHYEGAATITGALSGVGPDTPLDDVLLPMIGEHERIWFVSYQPEVNDPVQAAQQWFVERAVTMTQVYPSGMSITGYDTEVILEALPAQASALNASFENGLRVRGASLPQAVMEASDQRLHPPSAWIPVVLYLSADAPFDPATLRLRLTDAAGQTWGLALARGNDTLRRFSPTTWQREQIYETYLDVNLNPATPAGMYWLEVMLLDGDNAFTVRGADAEPSLRRVIIGSVTIE